MKYFPYTMMNYWGSSAARAAKNRSIASMAKPGPLHFSLNLESPCILHYLYHLVMPSPTLSLVSLLSISLSFQWECPPLAQVLLPKLYLEFVLCWSPCGRFPAAFLVEGNQQAQHRLCRFTLLSHLSSGLCQPANDWRHEYLCLMLTCPCAGSLCSPGKPPWSTWNLRRSPAFHLAEPSTSLP